jgi:L-asparagine transporter-like permease
LNKGTYKRKTHAQIKSKEQRHKQEENTRTYKNNWTKIQTRWKNLCSIVFICACVFLLFVSLFNCFYLCVCFPLVCAFVLLFNKGTYKRKTNAQIETIEQKCIEEETDVQIETIEQRYKQEVFLLFVPLFFCFYLCVCFPLVCTFVQLFLSVRVFSSCLYLCSIVFICACVFLLFVPLFFCFYYKQEEEKRTDKSIWTKVHTRGKQTYR